MTGRIVDISVRHRGILFVLVTVLSVLGWLCMQRLSVDALPDLSETQVIIYTKWDRSPDIIEDQVTYPIVTSLLGAPKVKTVRGISDFGYSYVYVVFDDKTDLYWARTRTMEYLSSVLPTLPAGVKTTLGPDATGLGWVFQYVLVDDSRAHDQAQLRSLQDWYLRYQLKSVPGVSEVATVGGFGKEYQVNVDPRKLQALGIGIKRVAEAVRASNQETGARLLEIGGAEHMVRGLGYAQSPEQIGDAIVTTADDGTPVRVRDVGNVVPGPELRRGLADLNGSGEAVSGIVVARDGENSLAVIDRVKKRLEEVGPGLPKGVRVVPIYDRSELIHRAIHDTTWTVIEVILTVTLVIFIFLWHVPSAVIPAITIPVTLLCSFIPFGATGLNINIMSLGGIAVAIGAMVDAAIVVVEQTHKRLEEWQESGSQAKASDVVIAAIKEVAGPSFFTLLVIGISFLPVLALGGQEGRLFKPLALTKTIAMIVAAFVALTLDPAIRVSLTRLRCYNLRPKWLGRLIDSLLIGRIRPERSHPVSRLLIRAYEPVVRWSLRRPTLILVLAALVIASTIPVWGRLGSEFMPTMQEGTLLYMPSTLPGISITEAKRLTQSLDRTIHQFPEVDQVLGKAGRADTATDPAPLSMLEAVITLKPRSEWRARSTWYSNWAPAWLKPSLRHITSDRISEEQLVSELNRTLQVPGLSNAWTMPIRGRVDMLTTGIRTPLGLKVLGSDPKVIQALSAKAAGYVQQLPGARSVFAERPADGFFVDIQWNRDDLARFGLSIEAAQQTLSTAVGGENVTTVLDGRARYPVSVRYMRDFRSDPEALGSVLLATEDGKRQIPVSEVATVVRRAGPSMIRDEDGLLAGYVYIDYQGTDLDGFVRAGKKRLEHDLSLPPGYTLRWSGQYEELQATRARLRLAVPLTILVIILLLWFNTKSAVKSAIILLAIPFSAAGALWLTYLLGYQMSVAVWIGLIALLGIDAETGIFMLLYLDLAYEQAVASKGIHNKADLHQVIVAGAARRIRPKFMTVSTMFVGLLPILWSSGTGSEVMKRVAAPMVGGIVTSFLLELLVYPILYERWKSIDLKRRSGGRKVGPEPYVLLLNSERRELPTRVSE